MKMLVIFVLIANGAALNLIVEPRLRQISFGQEHKHRAGELVRFRRLAFGFGAISIISWYSAFLLGALRKSPAQFATLFFIYFGLILFGIAMSQVVERRISSKAHKHLTETREASEKTEEAG